MTHKRTRGEVTFDVFLYIFMFLILFITVYPFWYIFAVSFNDGRDAMRGGIYFWPRMFTLDNYRAVFQNDRLLRAFRVSIARTIIGTGVSVFFTAMVAYAMSRSELIFRKFYMMVGIITMFFGGGLIPYFLVIRGLGLVNSFWVYIFPAMFSFWNMIIIMTFFRQLPQELRESADIDGAGDLRIFLTIILPLSTSVLAVIALFNGVFHWNDFFVAHIFINNQNLMPIQTVLFRIVAGAEAQTMLAQLELPDVVTQRRVTTQSIQLATMVVTTVPIICVYPFLQRYFVKGMLIGSVKG